MTGSCRIVSCEVIYVKRAGSIAAAIAMLVLILDTRTAISGGQEGAMLCFATVIPTLLPFFFLSSLLTSTLSGSKFPCLRPLEGLLGIPEGSGTLFLIGAFGGYPAGARAVAEAKNAGQLSPAAASRMLGFCSNAGPAFLFGICSAAFQQRWMPWLLWGIHLLSAIVTARLFPRVDTAAASTDQKNISLHQALDSAIKTMARVCGWIILFRVVIAFCNRWFLWYFSTQAQIVFNGILELTIGCTGLAYIENCGLRMNLCAAFLSFGGLCVAMQTRSVCAGLPFKNYILGKLFQTGLSITLAAPAQFLLPEAERCSLPPLLWISISVSMAILWLLVKKTIAFPLKVMYNHGIRQKQEAKPCSFESASKNPAPTAASARNSMMSRSSAPKRA